MKKIILFRHGETDWNRDKICLGSKHDILLNETGICQANQLSEKLSNENFDYIFTSPLSRASKTAQIVNKHHHVPINVEKNLIEIDYGDASGMRREEALKKYSDVFNEWMKIDLNSSYNLSFPNGENKGDFFNRIYNSIIRTTKDRKFKCIGISTHSGVIWNFFKYALNRDLNPVKHCYPYIFYYDNTSERLLLEN
jgi:broad specificity phosphatase PhoE